MSFYEIQPPLNDAPHLSGPDVLVLEGDSVAGLHEAFARLRDDATLRVCAVSPAGLTVGEPQYPDGSGLHYAYLMTVVYQARLLPNGPEGGDE